MYKVKITHLEGNNNFLKTYHKVGEIIEVADNRYRWIEKWVEVLEHYMLIPETKNCKECGKKYTKWIKHILYSNGGEC